MVTVSVTKARTDFYRLMNNEDEPVTITGRMGNKVLVPEADWRAIEETIYLNSVPGMTESIKEAHKSKEVFHEDALEW